MNEWPEKEEFVEIQPKYSPRTLQDVHKLLEHLSAVATKNPDRIVILRLNDES